MTPVSIGDLAQSLLLRRSVGSAQVTLDQLTAELASGQATDAGRRLSGQTAQLDAIDASLRQNKALQASTQQASARASAMQASLTTIDRAANEAAGQLVSAALGNDPEVFRSAGAKSRAALDLTVSAFNARHAGQALFAGVATEGNALADADSILAQARTAVAGATSPADVVALLKDWLDDPAGFAATSVTGSSDPVTFPVGSAEYVSLDASPLDPALRQTIGALILGSFLADDAMANSTGAASLAKSAGEMVYSAASPRTAVAARLGIAERRIEGAEIRLSAESDALGVARSDLLSVDLYETSSRLSEAETRLQTLYALTARLSRLSLADYL